MGQRIIFSLLLNSLLLPGQIPDFKPSTPLLGAVLVNDTKAVTKLLDEGANPNEGRFFGSLALIFAIIHANRSLVTRLGAEGYAPEKRPEP